MKDHALNCTILQTSIYIEFMRTTHKVGAKGPIVGEDVCEGEWHGEGAEEDVGHCQVCDKDDPRCEHCLPAKLSSHEIKFSCSDLEKNLSKNEHGIKI